MAPLSNWTKLAVERMLVWGPCLMGVRRYCYASSDCTHVRCQSCKSKACSSCGLNTEQWIAEQQHILAQVRLIPHLLWPFFNNNRPLLNNLFRCARRQGIGVGIFCALHTYGRRLNQHPHIHVSVTRGGLDDKHHVWRLLFFKEKEVEAIWRNAVVHLLRDNYTSINPGDLPCLGHIRNEDRWHRYLHTQYRRA
ncbi:hypothetical protein SME17J_47610 (plasmid) [Serratia marcescens]|nr:hypothetical protein SME17J_47610 [Serratia marcescens]